MNILVGYNGSEISIKALQLAQKEADIKDVQVIVVKILGQSRTLDYINIRKFETSLESEVNLIFNNSGLTYKTLLILTEKNAGEELVEYAKHYDVCEIVIGIRKRSKTGKFLLGSNAQHVILNAPCPVLTVN